VACASLRPLALAVLLLGTAPALAEDSPEPIKEPEGLGVPLSRIDDTIRRHVAATVGNYTTVGVVGPLRSPVTREVYEYLLDHPWVLAAFVNHLGLGSYEAVPKGRDQFWANDGDGTEGLVRLAYRDGTHRLYYIEGAHHGQVFPLVRAKAVVVVRLAVPKGEGGAPRVDTDLRAYTRLDDPVLDKLVWLLRPLIGDTVTQKLTRSFAVLNQVCGRIAQEPDRALDLAPPAALKDSGEVEHLKELIRRLPRQPVPPGPVP
jgi:hypothetical protein